MKVYGTNPKSDPDQKKRNKTISEKEYQMKQNRKENKPIEKKEKEIELKKKHTKVQMEKRYKSPCRIGI